MDIGWPKVGNSNNDLPGIYYQYEKLDFALYEMTTLSINTARRFIDPFDTRFVYNRTILGFGLL